MRILVVDDEHVSRVKLKTLLSQRGECDAAPDGEIALGMIERAWQEGVPYQLVTMDVNMPGLSGQETLRRLRRWEQDHRDLTGGEEVKVLMVTVADDIKQVMSSFSEGAEWYVVKPVTPEKITEALGKIDFTPKRRRRAASKPAPQPAAPAEAPGSIRLPDPAGISLDGLPLEIWEEYASSTLCKLSDIEQAALELEIGGDEDAGNRILRALHSLKGDSGVMSLTAPARVCHDLETFLHEQGCNAAAVDTILRVKDWFQAAVEDISRRLGATAET